MILIGTMQLTSTKLKGQFGCPNCGTTEDFRLRSSRPFLTLYFVPVLPIGALQEYVQCSSCRTSFEPSVLSNLSLPSSLGGVPGSLSPGGRLGNSGQVAPLPTFEEDLLTVIALMMVEDGHVTEDEIKIARRLYENICEQKVSREELGSTCSRVRLQRLTTTSFLATCGKRRSHDEKLLMVQAMFGLAGADGGITDGRLKSLLSSKDLLELDEFEFQRTIEATQQWLT